MKNCPHCSHRLSIRSHLIPWRWTPVRCPACGSKYTLHSGAMMISGGIGGGITAYLAFTLAREDRYLELAALVVALMTGQLLIEWAFFPGKRIENKEEPNQPPQTTPVSAPR